MTLTEYVEAGQPEGDYYIKTHQGLAHVDSVGDGWMVETHNGCGGGINVRSWRCEPTTTVYVLRDERAQ